MNNVTVTGHWRVVEDDLRDKKIVEDWEPYVVRLTDADPEHGRDRFRPACPGNEVRAEFELILTRIKNRPGWVRVEGKARLFEGQFTNCLAADLEGEQTVSFDLGPNKSRTEKLRVDNNEKRSDDYLSPFVHRGQRLISY